MDIEDKDILYKKEASYLKGSMSYGGMLILTGEYLVFKPHSFNVLSKEMFIKVKDIANIDKVDKVLGLSKQIVVTSRDGGSAYFVVWGRDVFINAVKRAAGIKIS
jgi:hypothetical protein